MSTHHLELSRLDTVVLAIVAGKYEPDVMSIQQELMDWFDAQFEYRRIYSSLEKLNSKGLVKKLPVDGRVNCYLLTNAGKTILEQDQNLIQSRLKRRG